MNTQNVSSPHSPLELSPGLLPVIPSVTEKSATTLTSDRLYQLAALTAGAFLLATLL
ncbi:MAG: hypothetical protein ABSA39_02080 [Edaphobacter sp.]